MYWQPLCPDGHICQIFLVEPTCTEGGFTTYTCTVCGDSYVFDETAALGHDWKALNCTRCSAVRENPFSDTDPKSFYFELVLWACDKGITNGISATEFGPTAACNRAQVVTFLWRTVGSPEPESTKNPFVDVQKGSFYEKAVLWAVEKGVTTGTDATHFSPTSACNRAQVVTFLWRAMGRPEVSTADCSFTDVGSSGAFYETPILWAVENGITNGLGDGTFGINTTCNRAQVITFLFRSYSE